MLKASIKMKKYYTHTSNFQTLRAIKAFSDEEAFEKFKEVFGNDEFVVGFLPRAEPKVTQKEMKAVLSFFDK